MKKKVTTLLTLGLFALGFTLSSCGGGMSEEEANKLAEEMAAELEASMDEAMEEAETASDNTVIGNWQVADVRVEGSEELPAEQQKFMEEMIEALKQSKFSFNEDGSFSTELKDGENVISSNGTWELNENVLSTVEEGKEAKEEMNINWEENKLVLGKDQDGKTTELVLERL